MGRLAAKGLVDGLSDKAYAIVDGIDGRAHYVPIGHADLSEFPVGGIVEARPTPLRAADRNIAALSKDGVYLTEEHRAHLEAHGDPRIHSEEIVDAHVRRLEALRRAGIVEREAEGIWRIPPDLVARGHAYDRQRTGGVDIQLHSHLPVDRQVTTMGATWLDRTLVNGEAAIGNAGFGATVKEALRKRVDFLVEHGFAQRDGEQMKLPSNLLTALRQRDLDSVAKAITAETGMSHRPLADGERATGVYRRMVVTASGRFAMLDDGLGFSLVPWRPVLEQRTGQQLTATIRGDHVIWSLAVSEVFRDSLRVVRRGLQTAARSSAMSGGSTIYTGHSSRMAGVRCPAAVRIGTVEGSDRPGAARRRFRTKRTFANRIS